MKLNICLNPEARRAIDAIRLHLIRNGFLGSNAEAVRYAVTKCAGELARQTTDAR